MLGHVALHYIHIKYVAKRRPHLVLSGSGTSGFMGSLVFAKQFWGVFLVFGVLTLCD